MIESSRKVAKRTGAVRYIGRPCRYGHLGERFTSSGTCAVCLYAHTYAWQAENRDKVCTASSKWRAQNLERARANGRAYKLANRAICTSRQQNRDARKSNQRCGCCTVTDLDNVYEIAALVNYEVDHTIPLSLGGHHCLSNIRPLSVEDHKLKTAVDFGRLAVSRFRNRLLKRWPRVAA